MTDKEILQELYRPTYLWRDITKKKEKMDQLYDMATDKSPHIELSGIKSHSGMSRTEKAIVKREELREQILNEYLQYIDAQKVIEKRMKEMPYPERDCIEIQYIYHNRYVKPDGFPRKVADIRESAIRIYTEIANRQTENEQ